MSFPRACAPLLALVLAGCAGLGPGTYGEAAISFGAPVAVSTTEPGAEPVIAVAPDGTAYVEGIGSGPNGNLNKVFRSDDGGTMWKDVTPPGPGEERSNDGFVAVADDGTVYAANVFSLTFQVYRSDDKGETWTKLNVPPLPSLMHRHWIWPVDDTLHVTIEALPPSFLPYLAGSPPAPADAADSQSGLWYMRSDDRGDSWTTPQQIDPVVNFAGQSNMVVSPDGARLYVGRYQEEGAPPEYTYDDGRWYLLASEDGGASWTRREMFELTSEMSTAVPGLALTTDGGLWFAWTQESNGLSKLRLADSRDGGRTWSAPREPFATAGTHAMAWAAGGPDGRLGLMWYEAAANGTASKVDAPWHVHYAELRAGELVGITRVTRDAVHHGNICAKGPACAEGEDRSLLDYPWLDFGPDGGAWLAFPSTEWDRPSAFAMVARQRVS